jgi:anti-sigma regulatory factor (Ser/Thr protein kinase)
MPTAGEPKNVSTLSLPADAAAAGTALQAVHRLADAAGLDADTRARLAVVVEELVVNAVEHGCPDPASRIDLTLSREAAGVRVELSDAGVAFDPRRADADPAGPSERGGNAGLALVRAWSRIASYSRTGGRNHLVVQVPDRRT